MATSEELLNQLRQRLDVPGFSHVTSTSAEPGGSGGTLITITVEVFSGTHSQERGEDTYARILTIGSNQRRALMKMFQTMIEVTDLFIGAIEKAKRNVKELRKDIMGMRGLQSLMITANAAERLQVLVQFLEEAEVAGATRSDYRAVIQEARMIVENER